MVGYIFCAENTVTHKKYIGKFLSVKFDRKHIGDNPNVLADVEKYGADKFIVNMLKVCEKVEVCNYEYDRILKELNAENDVQYYNCEQKVEEEPVKPKRTRKKKVVEE